MASTIMVLGMPESGELGTYQVLFHFIEDEVELNKEYL